ncbi:anti-sigma F factor antagonist [Paenibacillus ferrarius]|uniref:Anti-sigma factor antagonist n=1 Tax=Paenibacillus ferrarius TaxID=1469647 RepID=A0A1V4HNP4_9BACL|nr:STAS domain-containing protein [Paenibacillus ferrarius]OPH59397.1 anti-sigma F factor antagonist [Paenibacillus ferrarius]
MSAEKFQVDQEESEESIQLHIRGELDLAAALTFRHALEEVVHRADKALILDVGQLRYIDSTGIGIVVSALKIRDELKAPFSVRNIPASIRKLFDLTGISGFLNEGIEGRA